MLSCYIKAKKYSKNRDSKRFYRRQIMMEKFGGKVFEALSQMSFLVWTKMVGSNINFTFALEIIYTNWISLTFDINPLMI